MYHPVMKRFTRHWVMISLTLLWTCYLAGCDQEGVMCTSNNACEAGLVCVSTQCVGPIVEGDAYEVYVEEMHLRLIADCGICHGIRGEGPQSPTTGEGPKLLVDMPPPNDLDQLIFDPFALPELPVLLGDSGWRIYSDNLNSERLRMSYEDTLQYLNFHEPDRSLLLKYGQGEAWITPTELHPIIYNLDLIKPNLDNLAQEDNDVVSPEMINETIGTDPEPMGKDIDVPSNREGVLSTPYVGYERLRSWSGLIHEVKPGVGSFNLQDYLDGPAEAINNACGICHATPAAEPYREFEFDTDPTDPKDIASLATLINAEDPARSALIRMAYGEYEHQVVFNEEQDKLNGFSQAVIKWIQELP